MLSKKGHAIISSLKVLSNSIEGISPSNLHLLYKTVVILAVTYNSQLWYDPVKPNCHLIHKLEKIQHQALIQISGGFYDSPELALQLLMYIPPIETTLYKLYRSAALRIPHLPLSSEISQWLPLSYIPANAPLRQRIIPPKHIPFQRPHEREIKGKTNSPLSCMVAMNSKHMEQSHPFYIQNAPFSFKLESLPFYACLTIEPEVCPKKERRLYVANQHIWLTTRTGRNTLCIFTDGSKTDKATGWAITGIHTGHVIFSHKVPLAKKVSEPVLTPFQSVPIWNLITLSLCLTPISLYHFQYLCSRSTHPILPHYSLDLVVHFPCLPLQTLFHSYLGPASDPCWTCSYVSFHHMTSLNMFHVECHFHFGL